MSRSIARPATFSMRAEVLLTVTCLAQDKSTTITGQFTETHTKLECDCNPTVWTRNFTITLSGKNHVHEEWNGRNNNNLSQSAQHDSDLGEARGSAIWRVVGPNRIEKVVSFKQHVETLTVITSGHNCVLKVVYSLKPGFTDMYVPRADTGEWTHFTLPRVVQSSCEIN
jgi:hypothetical protein